METALRNRLTFGPIMLAGLFLLLGLDHAAERWPALTLPTSDGSGVRLRGIGIMLLFLAILPIAVREVATLFAAEQVKPYGSIAMLGGGSLVLHAFLTQFAWFQNIAASAMAFVIVFVMLFAALRRAWGRQTNEAIHHMAGTVLATLYLGGLGWFILALRVKHSPHFHGTTMTILMILLVVKFTDIGAYFGGRAFGRHKLIPWLSPGKTWEGLFFGVLTAGAVGAGCAPYIGGDDYHLPWWKGVIFGAVIGAIGQLGDLLESLMKRDADVKDSGKLVPGFGGILDIIDSPLLAAPFAYLMFSLF
jgi:phosphatidate cytidylyltransferase